MNFQEIDLPKMTYICIGYTIDFKDKNHEKIQNYFLTHKILFRKEWELNRLLNYLKIKIKKLEIRLKLN